MTMEGWRSLSVEQLHLRYEQEHYAPNMAEVLADFAEQSREVREALPFDTLRYGPGQSENALWAVPPEARPAEADLTEAGPPQVQSANAESPSPGPAAAVSGDIVCFIHGGAWRGGQAEHYLYPARWLCQQGMHYVALNFGNTLDFGGRIFPMVEQVTRGLRWVMRQAQARGANPRVHLVGHSSGAHLAACLATLDWSALVPEYPEALRSVLLCSGIYDLEPVSYSSRRTYLSLEPVEIHALSPQRQAFDARVPVSIACGERESPEFLRQSTELAAKLRISGVPVREAIGAQLNHFEICGTLGQKGGFLGSFFWEGLKQA